MCVFRLYPIFIIIISSFKNLDNNQELKGSGNKYKIKERNKMKISLPVLVSLKKILTDYERIKQIKTSAEETELDIVRGWVEDEINKQ